MSQGALGAAGVRRVWAGAGLQRAVYRGGGILRGFPHSSSYLVLFSRNGRRTLLHGHSAVTVRWSSRPAESSWRHSALHDDQNLPRRPADSPHRPATTRSAIYHLHRGGYFFIGVCLFVSRITISSRLYGKVAHGSRDKRSDIAGNSDRDKLRLCHGSK